MGIYVKRIREKVPDPQRKQCRRCHWCCRQYIHLTQRQLDLYLGQKPQETQHPFRPIIGKRLRGYRITNFEVESPATALAGVGSQFDSFIIKTLSLLSLTKQHHYIMEKITTIIELEKAFSIESLSKITDYDTYFKYLAESLFENFEIRNGDDVYRFVEIEFYLRKTESESRKIAYERETCAGEWFLHENGVDIAFESNKQFYGGILIRSIKKSVSYTVDGEFINGPRKCSWHIFDGLNAFAHNERITRIEEASVSEQIKSNAFTRHGIKDDDKLFRFTIPFELWNHKGYSGFPKK